MSDMDDIYYALKSGQQAAESLSTWVRGVDARDSVRSTQDQIKRGLDAY